MNPSTIVTQSAMVPFVQPSGGCGPVLSYLDPPLGAGVPRSPTDANRIITSNGQFFPLADQGTDGLKNFQNQVPICHRITPQNDRSWYTSLIQHASSCGFYVHPYFCFRSLAPSLSGFTCGYDTPAITGVAGSPLVPATLYKPAVQASHGVTAAPAVQATAEIPAVLAITAADI